MIVLLVACTRDLSFPKYYDEYLILKEFVIKIDAEFTEEEEEKIDAAIKAWEKASNYFIKIRPIWNQPQPGPFWKFEIPDKKDGIFIWRLNRHDQTQYSDKVAAQIIDKQGYCIRGTSLDAAQILIFADNFDEHRFYEVALHEIGHILRLSHSADRTSVMSEYTDSSCITEMDAARLCSIYLCNPKPECGFRRYMVVRY